MDSLQTTGPLCIYLVLFLKKASARTILSEDCGFHGATGCIAGCYCGCYPDADVCKPCSLCTDYSCPYLHQCMDFPAEVPIPNVPPSTTPVQSVTPHNLTSVTSVLYTIVPDVTTPITQAAVHDVTASKLSPAQNWMIGGFIAVVCILLIVLVSFWVPKCACTKAQQLWSSLNLGKPEDIELRERGSTLIDDSEANNGQGVNSDLQEVITDGQGSESVRLWQGSDESNEGEDRMSENSADSQDNLVRDRSGENLTGDMESQPCRSEILSDAPPDSMPDLPPPPKAPPDPLPGADSGFEESTVCGEQASATDTTVKTPHVEGPDHQDFSMDEQPSGLNF